MQKVISTLLIILCGFSMKAQSFFPNKKYPNQDFQNPLSIPISLVGNFGECRPNHFHSGIDIRTESKENLPVHAIADGYVSRVRIENSGFGNAIYITHANGFTSLYAHLNSFYPDLEQHVRSKQYEAKSWKIDMQFLPHQFPVAKGKFIAKSGNTGHSAGPHLHLEIRDAKTENPLNGLLFFNQIKDGKAPIIKQLAVYDGTKSIYEQKPVLHAVMQQSSSGKLANDFLKVNSSSVYFGIQAADLMEVAKGILGVYEMRMYVNDKPFFGWQLDNISYNITRYMNAQADYKTVKQKGPWIQLCRQLPTDKLPIYKAFTDSKGVLDLSDGNIKKVRIEALDTKGNLTQIQFSVQGVTKQTETNCKNNMEAGKANHFKNEYIELNLDRDALYDDICFSTSIQSSTSPYSYSYQVHHNYVPLHTPMDISFQPKKIIPSELHDKVAVVKSGASASHGSHGQAATMVYGRAMVSLKELGTYELVIDKVPPRVKSTIKNGDNISKLKRLNFEITEETTSVSSCVANVDGQWLRLVQKGSTYYYELDDYFPKGEHTLRITAMDENKNKTTLSYKLNR